MNQINERLWKRTEGRGDEAYITNKKNAFRFPKDPSSIIPQQKEELFIDRRTSAAPREILIQQKGIKTKNMKKQKHLDLLAKGMREAEGLHNEGEVIDMNKLANLDEFGNINFDEQMGQMAEMNIDDGVNKKNTKKKKEVGMELDMDFSLKNKNKSLNYRKRQNKKTKSSLIANF